MPGEQFHFTFEPGPNWTLDAVIQAAEDAPVRLLPEVVDRLVDYAKQNIEVGAYPDDFETSTGRDRHYGSLARSTVEDKMRMGAPYMKPGKRFGTNQASIHGSCSGDSVTIIADATHGAEYRRGAASIRGAAFGNMRDLIDLHQLATGMKASRLHIQEGMLAPITKGWEAVWGGLRPVTSLDYSGWKFRALQALIAESAAKKELRRMTGEPSRASQSYSAAVDAIYPFMRFHKGLITEKFKQYLDDAAGPAATGART